MSPSPPDLDPPAERAEAVAFVARTLAEELVDRLGGWGLACTQVVITAHTEHGETHERCWRLDGPARRAATVAVAGGGHRRPRPLAGRRLAVGPGRRPPTAGVSRLVLAPGSVEPARGRQLGFWGGEAGVGSGCVRAVARLEGLGGPRQRCGWPKPWRAPLGRRGGGPVPTAAVDVSVARPRSAAGLRRRSLAGPAAGTSPSVVHRTRPAGRGARRRGPVGRASPESGRGAPRRRHASGWRPRAPHDVVAWAGPWPVERAVVGPAEPRRRARVQVVTEPGVAVLLGRSEGSWWVDAVYA